MPWLACSVPIEVDVSCDGFKCVGGNGPGSPRRFHCAVVHSVANMDDRGMRHPPFSRCGSYAMSIIKVLSNAAFLGGQNGVGLSRHVALSKWSNLSVNRFVTLFYLKAPRSGPRRAPGGSVQKGAVRKSVARAGMHSRRAGS